MTRIDRCDERPMAMSGEWMRILLARTLLLSLVAGGCAACSRGEPRKAGPAAPAALATASAIRVEAGAPGEAASATFPIPKAAVDAVLNPSGLPAYEGPTGSVEGTVYVKGPAAPDIPVEASGCPGAVDTYGKLFRSGPPASSHGADGARPLGDAVVVVVGYSGFYIPEREPAVKVTVGVNCGYPARSIAMTYGQRLEVSNASSKLFAPMIDDEFSPAVMMAPPHEAGDPVKIYPRKPGYSSISDRMQPFVHEDLFVFRQPLHAVTGTDGHYRIDGLPVGKLTVGARHPGVGSESQAPIDVIANEVQSVDLTLTYSPKVAKRGAQKIPSAPIIP